MMQFYRVNQNFFKSNPVDVKTFIPKEMKKKGFLNRIKPGMKIGIAVGSRSISGIKTIVQTLAELIRERGAYPHIIAAMGSHGGGTVNGQLGVLSGLGITEVSVGIPVFASCECICIGQVCDLPVYVNRLALECDGIIPVNRIKPHTSFKGPVESGLTKMLVVGLGGPKGAEMLHCRGANKISELLLAMGLLLIEKLPVFAGVGVVEDGNRNLHVIRVCDKDEFIECDRTLLKKARELLPRLPFEEIDILLVNEMGKCFSGTGMDTNVIGRFGIKGMYDTKPNVSCLVVLDLAEASKGNANGIGLADITTQKLIEKIDYPTTIKNAMTTTFLERIKLPVIFESDIKAIEAAVEVIRKPPQKIKFVNIKNTLDLCSFYISKPLIEEAQNCGHLNVLEGPFRMVFDKTGNFTGYKFL